MIELNLSSALMLAYFSFIFLSVFLFLLYAFWRVKR